MAGIPRQREELRRQMPATLDAVDEFCAAVREWLRGLIPPSPFAVELLTREALANAVVHGCGCDSARKVTCVVRLRPAGVTIAVQDDGQGFDWRAEGARQTDPYACCGRGMAILKEYACRFRFNRSGNSLIIIERSSRPGVAQRRI